MGYYCLDNKTISVIQKARSVNFQIEKVEDIKLFSKQWEKVLQKELECALIQDLEEEFIGKISFEGIAFKFSKLKTNEEIIKFAEEYGLLGFEVPTKISSYFYEMKEEIGDSVFSYSWEPGKLLFFKTGEICVFEPIELWRFFIERVRRVLKLYDYLVKVHENKMKPEELEGNILCVGKKTKTFKDYYWLEWWDGKNTGVPMSEEILENTSFHEVAQRFLIDEIKQFTDRQISNTIIDIKETAKTPIGFTVEESKSTQTLITTIYNDIWQLIINEQPISICKNPKCQLPFEKIKRQKYCSNACKQEAYRIRKLTT